MRLWNNLHQVRLWNNLHQVRLWNNLHQVRLDCCCCTVFVNHFTYFILSCVLLLFMLSY